MAELDKIRRVVGAGRAGRAARSAARARRDGRAERPRAGARVHGGQRRERHRAHQARRHGQGRRRRRDRARSEAADSLRRRRRRARRSACRSTPRRTSTRCSRTNGRRRRATRAFMERALLPGRARPRAHRRRIPMVGAVVVSPRRRRRRAGRAPARPAEPHAEVRRARCGRRARARRDAVLHARAVLATSAAPGRASSASSRAGITRVVVADARSESARGGRGLRVPARARRRRRPTASATSRRAAQNAPFFTWITRRRPFVIVKAAVSARWLCRPADDRACSSPAPPPIATSSASAPRSTRSPSASGTVLVDDPLLTARGVYRDRPLTRVVFDWRLRVPPARARVLDRSSGAGHNGRVGAGGGDEPGATSTSLERRGVDDRSAATTRDLAPVLELARRARRGLAAGRGRARAAAGVRRARAWSTACSWS